MRLRRAVLEDYDTFYSFSSDYTLHWITLTDYDLDCSESPEAEENIRLFGLDDDEILSNIEYSLSSKETFQSNLDNIFFIEDRNQVYGFIMLSGLRKRRNSTVKILDWPMIQDADFEKFSFVLEELKKAKILRSGDKITSACCNRIANKILINLGFEEGLIYEKVM